MTNTAHDSEPFGFNLAATIVKVVLVIILKEVFEHVEEKPGEVTDNVDDDDGGQGESEGRVGILSSYNTETFPLQQNLCGVYILIIFPTAYSMHYTLDQKNETISEWTVLKTAHHEDSETTLDC